MTPDAVADRIYDCAADLSRGESGIVLPSSALTIAVRVLCDIVEMHDWNENTIAPGGLADAVAYVTERVRLLLADDNWRGTTLDDDAAEILRHTMHMLTIAGASP